jgi:hypothetical protein
MEGTEGMEGKERTGLTGGMENTANMGEMGRTGGTGGTGDGKNGTPGGNGMDNLLGIILQQNRTASVYNFPVPAVAQGVKMIRIVVPLTSDVFVSDFEIHKELGNSSFLSR